MITSLTYLTSQLHFAEISFWILAGRGGGSIGKSLFPHLTLDQKCSINDHYFLPENVRSERKYMNLRKRDDFV